MEFTLQEKRDLIAALGDRIAYFGREKRETTVEGLKETYSLKQQELAALRQRIIDGK